MTTEMQSVAQRSTGWTEAAAKAWVEHDTRSQELALPWNLAAQFVSQRLPEASLVLDIASGPGSFLAFVLEALPNARGVWLDFSEVMLDRAKANLAPFSDRVDFVLGDILGLEEVGEAESFDIVVSSRAAHHLGVPGVGRFYSQVASRLRPNGWLANLDLFRLEAPWDGWLRDARNAVNGVTPSAATHPDERPAPFFEDHLAGIRAAGLGDAQVPWRSFLTALFVAQKLTATE